MGIPGINLPNLTMLPESIRPIKHQTYKDRLDESLGMRRGPERNFRQSMADRRDESIGASLGRYGEPGLPSLAPRKTIPRATKGQFLPKPHKLPRPITAPVMPPQPRRPLLPEENRKYSFPASTDWYNPVTGERITTPSFRADGAPPKEGFIEVPSGGIPSGISLPGEPELTPPVVDPIQEAVDAAVGGGRDPWENYLPSDHPFYQSPEFLAHQEKNKDFIGLPFHNPYPASDGTLFADNLGEIGKLYDQWLINQQNQADPVQEAVDAAVGPIGGETEPGLVGGVDFMPGYRTDPWTPPILPEEITPPPVVTDPVQEAVDAAVGGETPVADEVPFMDQLQAMVDQILAQQAEQQTAQQQAQQQQAQQAQNYTLSGSRIGYNPYTSGQYQADPYGAAGVPDMGGLTTIPVPQPLTGIGYANYQAPENMT
jgi:hypothetical protein